VSLTEGFLTEAGGMRGLEAGANRVTENYGAGGGGGITDPEAITGCLGWGQVDLPGHVTLDGSSLVNDFGKPGMPMVLNQASPGDAPAVTGTINGEAAITFDGTDWMVDWSYSVPIAQPTTIGIRFQLTNATPVNGIWARYNGLFMAENSVATGGGGRWAWNSGNPSFALPGVDTNPHTMMGVFNSPASSQWFDGVKVGTQDTGASGTDLPAIGSPDNKPFMKVTRWAFYGRALTDTEAGLLSAWLAGT
jgi:hypothetical protein